jgi:hypothetical protein
MVRFFDEKYELFGAEKLTKDITLADMDPDDITTIENGLIQVLLSKDGAGRKVVCFFPKLKVIRTAQNAVSNDVCDARRFIKLGLCYRSSPFFLQLRACYYTLMKSVEDDEGAQKRGFVACMYSVGGGLNIDLQIFLRKTTKLRGALPVRIGAAHVCYSDLMMVPFFSLAMFIMGTHTRMRFRTHYGSHEECRCQLSSFGIPIFAFPVSPRGEFNLENHRTFVAMQRTIEATKSKGKRPLLVVAPKAKREPTEKARSRQPIIEEDVFVAAPGPGRNEPTGYGGMMGFLPQPSFAKQCSNIVGAPTLPPMVPTQSQVSVVAQSHIIGPTRSASRAPAKFRESPAKPYVIYDPLPSDILFGRGKPIQERPGHVRFREILDKHMDLYDNSEKGDKPNVMAYIVHLVKEEDGRFLKELEDGGWVEVDEATARAKVGRAFRTRRKALQATLK